MINFIKKKIIETKPKKEKKIVSEWLWFLCREWEGFSQVWNPNREFEMHVRSYGWWQQERSFSIWFTHSHSKSVTNKHYFYGYIYTVSHYTCELWLHKHDINSLLRPNPQDGWIYSSFNLIIIYLYSCIWFRMHSMCTIISVMTKYRSSCITIIPKKGDSLQPVFKYLVRYRPHHVE
jgi:hypothetical protein